MLAHVYDLWTIMHCISRAWDGLEQAGLKLQSAEVAEFIRGFNFNASNLLETWGTIGCRLVAASTRSGKWGNLIRLDAEQVIFRLYWHLIIDFHHLRKSRITCIFPSYSANRSCLGSFHPAL